MYAQIVTFRTRPDTSREDFLALSEQMVVWLKQQEGFVAYALYEGDGCWSDRIVWQDEQFAKAGLHRFRDTVIAEAITPLVESDFNSFFGREVITS